MTTLWRVDFCAQLGVVFLEQGKASQALAYLDKALEFDPEHEQALLNSAILLQELGRAELRKVARERLLKLLRKVISGFMLGACIFIMGFLFGGVWNDVGMVRD